MQISTILALLLRPAPAHFLCDSEFIAATRLPVGGQIWGRNTPLKSACDPSPDPFCCWGRTGPWPAPWTPWCGIAICLATGVEADVGLVLGQAPLGVEADVGLVPGQGPPWCRGRCLFPSYDPLGSFALASWCAWKSGYGGSSVGYECVVRRNSFILVSWTKFTSDYVLTDKWFYCTKQAS